MSALKILGIDRSLAESRNKNYSPDQLQTQSTFGFKWKLREFYENESVKEAQRQWLYERYCGGDKSMIYRWLDGGGKIILDAGCGSGYSGILFWGDHINDNYYLGVDISEAVEVAEKRFQESGLKGEFLKVSLTDLPVPDDSVDIIFSEGVLHHTDSTEKSLYYLSRKLKKGGIFLFYVYIRKAPVREFTDDLIRDAISNMTNEEAWEALMPLTRFGKYLADLNIELDIPEDVPYLGIKKGKIDLQRFFYWYIVKMWTRPDVGLNEMNLVNFDWFRPLNCHRHTPEEVKMFCRNSGLHIERMHVMESGITVVARKI